MIPEDIIIGKTMFCVCRYLLTDCRRYAVILAQNLRMGAVKNHINDRGMVKTRRVGIALCV